MSNKMLIDASHPEETRVVVTKGSRIEEFDFESEYKKQLKGNIYLARITRVEPSLQAAFVEYGGNRHGFLAFSEIHPDYYQIPTADRQILLEAEEKSARKDEDDEARAQAGKEDDEAAGLSRRRGKGRRRKSAKAAAAGHAVSDDAENYDRADDGDDDEKPVDLGAEDALEEVPARSAHRRDYKIQEVIKRRQILLVQIVKEERGNKGAALTTYLSLAGRYSVLMPNTARGGGISRKITNISDRKRLKDIVKGLAVPRGMGIILRTAGASRTKTEVRRDYDYLMRLWENVRSLTLTSVAPALVYEEGSLIKRSIRDLYNKDIDEVLVSGDDAYREAKDFMRMLMPSHAKFVQPYREPAPIFARSGIEAQLDSMLQPEAGLKSGGYLVINQTEALVAVDVNSGRSTREHSVEDMALQTNLEAAEEVARQLRLRDLAGLIVIDFIDMQEKRNIRSVEKKLKDCLQDDRARIQVGRISHFGLLEMSRQRIRASVLESTTQPCPHCFGTGYVRSQSSLALHVLRMVEEYLQRGSSHNIAVRTPVSTALYVLNHKRRALNELEERFGLTIDIEADETIGKEHLAIYKTSEVSAKLDAAAADETETAQNADKFHADADEGDNIAEPEPKADAADKRRGGRDGGAEAAAKDSGADERENGSAQAAKNEEERRNGRRRRGRRGGRRGRDYNEQRVPAAEPVGAFAAQFALSESAEGQSSGAERGRKIEPRRAAAEPVGDFAAAALQSEIAQAYAEKPRRSRFPRRRGGKNQPRLEQAENPVVNAAADRVPEAEPLIVNAANPAPAADMAETKAESAGAAERKPRARRSDGGGQAAKSGSDEQAAAPVITSSGAEQDKADKAKKKGWWGRRSFF